MNPGNTEVSFWNLLVWSKIFVAHSFLLEAGYWSIQGHWLERERSPIPVKGKALVAWREDWFTMVTKLIFPGQERSEITLQYRGHLDDETQRYTFVLMHSVLGRVEGEGWIGPESIIQRYWVLGDTHQRRSGFDTIYRVTQETYHISNAVMAGHYLTTAMEATLQRQRS